LPTTDSLSDDYVTLGLSNDATLPEVKQAYRDLAMVWHPDRFGQGDTRLRKKANQKLQEINDSYRRIVKALTHNPPQSASSTGETPLNNAVDDVTAFIALVAVQALNIDVLMMLGSASRIEIESSLKDFSENSREAVKRVEALIRRFERELPEYPRAAFESMLITLSQQESKVTKAVAAYIHIHSEPYQEARQSTPPPREPVDATSFGHHATHNEPKDKRNLKWVVLFLLGAAGLWLIIARTSSTPSQPSTSNSTSTSSEFVALKPSPSEKPQPADPSASTIADDTDGTKTDLKSVTISSPGTYAESASSLKDVDFKNRTYTLFGGTVDIRAGAYKHQESIGYEEAEVGNVWFLSDSGNESGFAVVSIGNMGCGGSCSSERYVQVFTLVNDRLEMVQELRFDDQAKGAGVWFDANSRRLTIRARSNDDSPHCCPKSLDLADFIWNGQEFTLEKAVTIPVEP
jgi:hypothetical protein